MLIIDSKDCENIDKALKKYKKKFEKKQNTASAQRPSKLYKAFSKAPQRGVESCL